MAKNLRLNIVKRLDVQLWNINSFYFETLSDDIYFLLNNFRNFMFMFIALKNNHYYIFKNQARFI